MNKPIRFYTPTETKCFCCEKELHLDHDMVMDGGYAEISFHYGSRFDQCHGFGRRKEGREKGDILNKILSADIIEAFICDDCFEKKALLCRALDTIDYEPIKKEQDQNLVAIAKWFRSEEGKAEYDKFIEKSAESYDI